MIFFLGSIYSIILIFLGGFIGYKIGKNELAFMVKSVENKLFTPPRKVPTSGPVRAISPNDIKEEQTKTITDAQRNLTSDIGELPSADQIQGSKDFL